jgi:peptidoglycan/xylan/chitin deacetylase (PgdA/CDA1 family)
MREHLAILNFHGLGTPTRALDDPEEWDVWLDADDFESVLDGLATTPAVALTFDDGNKSDIEVALPALCRRGLTATFFLLAGRLGDAGYLTDGDARLLVESGMSVGSHGMDHRSWRGLDADGVRRELVEARDVLETACGRPVTAAACPFGAYDRRTLGHLRRKGYLTVFTSDGGPADANAWLQPRTTVRRGTRDVDMRAGILHRRNAPVKRLVWSTKRTLKRAR